MEKIYIVYKHTNNINNKVYIGITKEFQNPNKRWRNGYGYLYNEKFFNDIIKYGWDNFTHEILESNLSYSEAGKKETDYIRLYNSIEAGYNNMESSGGFSPNTIQKISKIHRGKQKKLKSIQKQLETKKQRYGTQRGVHSYTGQGKKVRCIETNDVFASIAEAGRWCKSNKVGECCRGNRVHAGRHPVSNILLSWEFASDNDCVTINCEEDREIRKIQKVKCLETGEVYENATQAHKITGVATCNILRVCKGERKSAGGFHWCFVKEE